MSLELVLPGALHGNSYHDLVAEFVAAGEKLVPFTLSFEHADFGAFLARLDACAAGIGIPPGFVAHTTYFLVRDHREVVGVANLRHQLTPALRVEGGHIGYGIRPGERRKGYGTEILKHTLERAARHGIDRALLTCAKHNVASATIILRNGGVLDSETSLPQRGEVVQRYWIGL